jgi:hypothetical protein
MTDHTGINWSFNTPVLGGSHQDIRTPCSTVFQTESVGNSRADWILITRDADQLTCECTLHSPIHYLPVGQRADWNQQH